MKKLIGLVIALLLGGVLLGWYQNSNQAQPSVGKTTAPVSKSEVVTAPKQAPTNLSKTQPVAAPVESSPTLASASAAVNSMTDAHVELNTAVTDMIDLLEANDVSGFLLKYSSPKTLAAMAQSFTKSRAQAAAFRTANNLPQLPDQTFEESVKAMGSTNLAPMGKAILAELKALQTTTPKLNAAGDEAVYTLDPTLAGTLPGSPESITLKKENGQWFADALMN